MVASIRDHADLGFRVFMSASAMFFQVTDIHSTVATHAIHTHEAWRPLMSLWLHRPDQTTSPTGRQD